MTKFWRQILIGIAVAYLTLPPPTIYAKTVATVGCDDVQFIFARGSGESLGDVSARTWEESLRELLAGSNLQYSFYELGSARQGQFQYPAVAVSGSSQGYLSLIGAYISSGMSYSFGKSVAEGRGELSTYLTNVHSTCPKTKFVLGGYSQGAMVISGVLPQFPPDLIIYAATFGDPKLYLPEGNSKWFGFQTKIPAACYGRELSNYRAYVPNCYTYEGILGGIRPYQTESFYDKIGAWCNDNDIMCSSSTSLDDHLQYVSKGLYRQAAAVIARKIAAALPGQTTTTITKRGTTGKHELAILFNQSGAAPVLEETRAKILTLGTKVLSEGGDVALRWQTDYGGEFSSSSGYSATTSCYKGTFSSDFCRSTGGLGLGNLQTDVAALEAVNNGAWATGVFPSAYNLMKSLNWQYGATKSLVIFSQGDPYYRNTQVGLNDLVGLSLSIDPVNIYVVTDEVNAEYYAPLAELTNGGSFLITDNAEVLNEAILTRPVAELALAEYSGIVGEEFFFDASGSVTASDTKNLHFDWDLNFDNDFEIVDGDSVIRQTYYLPQSGYIQVRVRDDYGRSSTMSAHVEVMSAAPQLATITAMATPLTNNQAQIDFQTVAPQVLVALDDAVVGIIDVTSQTSFTLTDLAPDGVIVTLVPLSINGQRGQTLHLEVLPLSTEITPEPDQNSPTIATPSANQPTQTPIIQVPSNEPEDTTMLPKVPNSGSAPRRRNEELTM